MLKFKLSTPSDALLSIYESRSNRLFRYPNASNTSSDETAPGSEDSSPRPDTPTSFSAGKPPVPPAKSCRTPKPLRSASSTVPDSSTPVNGFFEKQSDLRYRSYSGAADPSLPSVVRDTIDLNITFRLPNGPMYDDTGPGFGFRIIGGHEEGTQVSVGHIVPQSVAAADGRLLPGDEIIEIDGCCVLNASHARVVDLILQSRHRGVLNVTVRRPRSSFCGSSSSSPKYPFNCTLRKSSVHESFGFVILSSVHKCSSIIGRVIEGTPAAMSGLLTVGDRILAVNGMKIDGIPHRNVVSLIKESGTSITLTVGAPTEHHQHSDTVPKSSYYRELAEFWRQTDGCTTDSVASSTLPHRRRQQSSMSQFNGTAAATMVQRPATALNRTSDTSRAGSLDSHMRTIFFRKTPTTTTTTERSLTIPETQFSAFDDDHHSYRNGGATIYDKFPGSSEDQIIEVDLPRAWNGYGFSIRGGHEYGLPLFVLKIATGGPAHMDGRIIPGDQIVDINNHRTAAMTHKEAISLIKKGENNVRLVLLRRGWRSSQTPLATDEIP